MLLLVNLSGKVFNLLFMEDTILKLYGRRMSTFLSVGFMMARKKIEKKECTNPTVASVSTAVNSVEDILRKARALVFSAIQKGWSGPPFDPFKLADILKIPVIPSEDILDARLIAAKGGKLNIEFNPNRPRARIRYSIAHELAHTLSPDCARHVRNRNKKEDIKPNDWQMEMLCNIGAAELLMPIGSFPDLAKQHLNIDSLMDLRKQYEVSAEALLLRAVKLTDERCVVFCSSKRESKSKTEQYQIDYMVSSRTNNRSLLTGSKLPSSSIVGECKVVGFTAKGNEEWPSNFGKVHIQCVALPPYPMNKYPRVAGLASLRSGEKFPAKRIKYLKGDATEPRGKGDKIMAFIINDKGHSWGAGFARAVQKKWPFVLDEFQHWITHSKSEFTLGNIHTSKIEGDLAVIEMVSQHGYGDSITPRIRYKALDICLRKLAKVALRHKASVHMPRIGCGQAGGSWWIVSELIEDILIKAGVTVTVYDLPDVKKRRADHQLSFSQW